MPTELITSDQLEELRLKRCPSFVPVEMNSNITKSYDNETGIVQRRLSNGIPIHYKVRPCNMFKLYLDSTVRPIISFKKSEILTLPSV